MKKRMLALLLVGIMLLAFPVCAENTLNVTFQCDTAEDGSLQYHFSVKGNYEDGETMVTLSFRKESGETVYADQMQTGADGAFAFEVLLKEGGNYSVRVNSSAANQILQKNLTLRTKDEYDSMIALFNKADATAQDYEQQIALYAEDLGLDVLFYQKTTEGKNEILNQMLQQKGNYTISGIPSIFTSSVILGILNSNEKVAFKDEVFQYYVGTNFVLDDKYRTLYESYCNFGETLKQKVWENINKETLDSYEKVCERFYLAVTQSAFSDLNAKKLDQFILDNWNCFRFPDYKTFSTAKKSKVLTGLKAKSFSSFSELETNYTKIVNELEKPTPTSKPSGGSSGSSISYPQTTKPSPTQTPEPPKDLSFTDLKDVSWAEEAIRHLQDQGVVSGKEDGIFAPNDSVTRAEFCKILVNSYQLLDAKAESSFADVAKDAWYYSYVSSAYCYGIINGYEDSCFRPDESVSREEMVTMLYRLLQKKRLIEEVSSVENMFRDFDNISDYAKNAVLILSNAGYVKGAGEEQFLPKNTASRAEVCVLIYNTLKGGNRG